MNRVRQAFVVLLALWMTTVLSPLLLAPVYKSQQHTSPISNTTMNADGSIDLNPQNGCGPFAHVEDHPPYGALCVLEARWEVAQEVAPHEATPPCAPVEGNGGSLLTCHPSGGWHAGH